MRKAGYIQVLKYVEDIRECLKHSSGLDADVKITIAEIASKIADLASVEHMARNGFTTKSYENKTNLSENDIVKSDVYMAMVNLRPLDSTTVNCTGDEFHYARSLLKKHFPGMRFRSMLLPTGARLVTRIEDATPGI